MFKSQGRNRTERQNRLLAGSLALTGGFVNSAGFVLIGTFTSHVTGNVGRLANDVAAREPSAALATLSLILAFGSGAFLASMMIESDFFGSTSNAYGVALSAESLLLLIFIGTSTFATTEAHPHLRDVEAALLCASMGMQNSLVTRLSGAVVRTTHLTGVVTDIGIEGARWFRWWRGTVASVFRIKLAFGQNPPERPSEAKIALLATIAGGFTGGALLGAEAGSIFRQMAMTLPTLALVAGATYAFRAGRGEVQSIAQGPGSRG